MDVYTAPDSFSLSPDQPASRAKAHPDACISCLDRVLMAPACRMAPGCLDALLDFRRAMAMSDDGAEIVRAYFRLAPVLARTCYLSWFRIRKEVERAIVGVVSAPEWTGKSVTSAVRLDGARSLRLLEARLKRDFFEHASVAIPLDGIRVRCVRAA